MRRARQRRRRLLDREPRPDGRPHRRLVDGRAAADAPRPASTSSSARRRSRPRARSGVATGGANVQFAVHPETSEFRVIEMNPRVSRSSALASKATGFPIAKLAALLAVGYTLDELPNDITGKTTAAFEPALDYVAVKAPRFDFEKFPLAERAARRRDARGRRGARPRADVPRGVPEGDGGPRGCRRSRSRPTTTSSSRAPASRCRSAGTCCSSAARRGLDLPGIHPYFADRLREIAACDHGRARAGPARLAVDSCAGEFEARTPYYYVTHEGADEGPEPSGRAVIVLGGGPNRIGQAIEFDYCCVHAAQALQQARLRGGARQLEPRDGLDRLRHLRPALPRAAGRANVLDVCELEQPVGVAVSFGGQTPLRLAPALAAAGVPLLGDPLDAIDAAEDRGRFARARGRPRAGVGRGRRTPSEAREVAAPARLPGARPPAPRARRARDARRALGRTSCASTGRASSTATSRARSSSTSTRSATARTRGSRPCSSTSSRRASTRATRPASCPGRR